MELDALWPQLLPPMLIVLAKPSEQTSSRDIHPFNKDTAPEKCLLWSICDKTIAAA
jgi:hypothetical protein